MLNHWVSLRPRFFLPSVPEYPPVNPGNPGNDGGVTILGGRDGRYDGGLLGGLGEYVVEYTFGKLCGCHEGVRNGEYSGDLDGDRDDVGDRDGDLDDDFDGLGIELIPYDGLLGNELDGLPEEDNGELNDDMRDPLDDSVDDLLRIGLAERTELIDRKLANDNTLARNDDGNMELCFCVVFDDGAVGENRPRFVIVEVNKVDPIGAVGKSDVEIAPLVYGVPFALGIFVGLPSYLNLMFSRVSVRILGFPPAESCSL